MDLIELITLSIQALRRNLLRTLLTMLGIIIGIASVIIIMSLGQGATASIVDEISSFGVNNLTISPGSFRRGPVQSSGASASLTRDDAQAIEDQLTHIAAISSSVSGRYQILANGQNVNESVTGVDASYAEVSALEITSGTFFDKADVTSASRIAVVGEDTITELFGENAQAIGEKIKIDNRPFHIVAVVSNTSSVYVPITTAMTVLAGRDNVDNITVQVDDADYIDQVTADIENLLMNRHDITDPDLQDFSIRSSAEMIESVSQVTGTLTAMLSAIAAISLVVGGIGIMNIMLVTVTERTKEIGLLKALGAKRQDILTQFLIEAIVLTLTGGLIGMTIGLAITYLAASALSIEFIISTRSVLLAVGVSTLVGVLFGYYPARRASRLNPIEALRYE